MESKPVKRTKICKHCGNIFTLNANNQKYCGRRCADAKYRIKNKDKIKEQDRKYREANKETISERGRRYYEVNKEKISEREKSFN